MIETLVVVVAIAGGLACPLHMWLSHRRGTKAACCAPAAAGGPADERDELHHRQQQLARLIADAQSSQASDASRH